MPSCNIRRELKDLSQEKIPPTRGQAKRRSTSPRALIRPKGDVRGKRNVPKEGI